MVHADLYCCCRFLLLGQFANYCWLFKCLGQFRVNNNGLDLQTKQAAQTNTKKRSIYTAQIKIWQSKDAGSSQPVDLTYKCETLPGCMHLMYELNFFQIWLLSGISRIWASQSSVGACLTGSLAVPVHGLVLLEIPMMGKGWSLPPCPCPCTLYCCGHLESFAGCNLVLCDAMH